MTLSKPRFRNLRALLLGLALTAVASISILPLPANGAEAVDPSAHSNVHGGIVVECRDAQTGPVPQGDANFSGMVFRIMNESPLPVSVQGATYGPGETICQLITDEQGRASTGDTLLPAGDYRVQLVDSNPSMTRNAPDQIARVRLHGQMVALSGGASFRAQVARGALEATILCTETGTADSPGLSATDGTRFAVENRSDNDVVVEGMRAAPGEVACYLEAVSGCVATDGATLPTGRYALLQIEPSPGCLSFDETAREFTVTEDGGVVTIDGDDAFRSTPIRGDMCFTATSAASSARKPFTPFALTSETTGETHVLVTDENGFASTQSAWNPHCSATNAADSLLDALRTENFAGAVDPTWAKAGSWFGASSATTASEPVDDRGALPYDRYTLQELPCASNDASELIRIEGISIVRHGSLVNLGTLKGSPNSAVEASLDQTAREAYSIPADDPLPLAAAQVEEHASTSQPTAYQKPGSAPSSAEVKGDSATGSPAPNDAEQTSNTSTVQQPQPDSAPTKAIAKEALDQQVPEANQVLGYPDTSSDGSPRPSSSADNEAPDGKSQPLAKTSDGALPASASLLLVASGSLMAIATSRLKSPSLPARKPTGIRSLAPLAIAATLIACTLMLFVLPMRAFGAVSTVRDVPDGVPASEIVFDYDRTLAALSPSLTVSSGSPITTRVDLAYPNWKVYRACWSGSVNGTVTIPGTVTYMLHDVGFDLDGDRVDLRIDVSNVTLSHRREGTLSHTFCISELWVNDKTGAWDFYLTSSCLSEDEQYYSAGSRNMTVRAFKKGSSTPASGRFVSQFVDLDIADLKFVNDEPVSDYSGPFTEQVQLLSGYDETVHLASDCALNIDKQTATFIATGVDENTLKSGFVATLDGRGFTLHWKGRNCSTGMLALYGSAVINAKAGKGGAISSPGDTVVGWKHSKTYEATPKEGYELIDLIVDGQSAGALPSYTFENVQEDHTIEAVFAPIGYKVVFDANQGVGSMDDQPMTFDKTERLRTCTFSRAGYDFAGWNTAPEGGKLGFDDGQEVMNLASTKNAVVTLYAQWVEKDAVPIQYNCGDPDHGSVDNAMEMLAPATGEAEGSSALAMTGYHVKEWRDKTGCVVGGEEHFRPTRQPDELWQESRYVAIIEPNAYRIVYHPDEGSGAMEDSWLRYDEESSLAANRFVRAGYTMVGWVDDDGNEYADESMVYNLTDEDGGIINLHALWEENPPDDAPYEPAKPNEPEDPNEPPKPADPIEPPANDDPEPVDPPAHTPNPSKPAQPSASGSSTVEPPAASEPGDEPPEPSGKTASHAPLAKTQDDKLTALAGSACVAAAALALVVFAAKRQRDQHLRRQRALSSLKRANEVLDRQRR